MDYNDSWEVTIVPSVTSKTTSSNDTIAHSTRTLSTISERESKDFCLPFDGNERKKDTYKNAERSKITSVSSTCQKLNHDYSRRSFKSDKQLISVLHGNKKESYDKINKEDTHSQTCKDMNNASDIPFIELGAVYKILDFITDSDPKVFALTNNCCNEISRTLQCLLAQRHDKKLEDLLLKDSSLHKCERCGVISYILESHPTIKKIKKNRTKTKHDDEIIIAERDCINNDQNNEEFKTSISPPDLINNAQSRINDCKVNNRTEYKDKLSEMESLSTNDNTAFIMKRCIESPNDANNISVTKADISATIKNKFYSDNNAIKKLFTDLETEKKNKRYECNSARNNPDKYESSNARKAYASIDREEVVREILYEPKSQVDDLLARDRRSSVTQTIQDSQRVLNKHGDIYPIVNTVKYLARGQFTELDKREDELLSKLRERRYTRLDDSRNRRSSVLYSSREDYPQRGAGFWLFDESGYLSQIPLDEYRFLPMPRIDNNRVNVPANISLYSHMTEKVKGSSRSNYMEKDSLEDCTLLKQREESNATIFSSSSVENLIRGSLDRKYEINDEDIPRGRKLVSSRPSLDIARRVRAQIAKDRLSGKAKESIGELCTHDSNVLVRLSPETRRKICHLIETIVSSDNDSTFFHKKYLTNMLNSEKLLHSKSADATFAHSNKCYKTDNEITNIYADDCIPTKLSELPEDGNRLIKRQNNFVNIRSQEFMNKSKDSVKIFHDNTTSVSDKSAHNSTKKIVRQIVYKDAALKNIIGNDDGYRDILLIYRKILENSGNMDWENFREFVEVLHPDEKELWRDVCKTINEEARKIGGDANDNTEICIEISPVNPEETLKTGKVMTCLRKIVFELDMTLKNVENFLDKRLAEERLDTHKNAEDVTDWSGGRRF